MATLPDSSAWVCVGPPLLANGPRFNSADVFWVNPVPQLPSVSKFTPLAVMVPLSKLLEQFPLGLLLAKIEFLILTVPAPLSMPPP
jgi:hypothetical protein